MDNIKLDNTFLINNLEVCFLISQEQAGPVRTIINRLVSLRLLIC